MSRDDLWRQLAYLQVRYGLALDSVSRLMEPKAKAMQGDIEPLKNELEKASEQGFRRGARALGLPARKPTPNRRKYKQNAAQFIPQRLVLGPTCMTRIPRQDREEWHIMRKRNGVTGPVARSAESWADGQRTVAEIEELVQGETGTKDFQLLEFFKGMEKYGYVKLHKQ